MIPKIIYMCYKNLEDIQKYSVNWKTLNPDYDIKLFDNERCEKFLLEEYSQLHCDIFKYIKDGPIKADFWRVCVIYKYGGLYVDADIEPLVPLDEFIEKDSDFVTCVTDCNNINKSPCELNPHFIMSKNNNEILKKCIDKYISFFNEKKEYGYWEWSICGIMRNILNLDSYKEICVMDGQKCQFLQEYAFSWKINKISQHYCKYKKLKVLNNRYLNYTNHSFNKNNDTQQYVKPSDISKTKIAITFAIPDDQMNIFSNGIKQNILFFYDLLENIGYDVYLVVWDDKFKYTNHLNFWNNGNIKYIRLSQILSINPHIVIQFGFDIAYDLMKSLKEKNIRVVFYECSNNYLIESESCLFSNNNATDFQYNKLENYTFDEIWLIPQMVNSCKHYMKTLYRTNVVNVPFVWSPSIIENYSNEFSKIDNINLFYKNRGKEKNISIFEPNLSIMKWSLPSILICENVERTISDNKLIKHVYVTNIKTEDKTFKFSLFNKLLKSLDLYKNKKLSVEARYNSLYFMSKYSDIAVSHQMENPLNYLYLDLAWMGWPIVHNAHLCKDVGYYYEGFDYEQGAEILKDVILTHDDNVEEYVKRNRSAINRYLPTNKYLQEQYKQLINKLL
jgi:mannosyltransferase OCH1-like enzyme